MWSLLRPNRYRADHDRRFRVERLDLGPPESRILVLHNGEHKEASFYVEACEPLDGALRYPSAGGKCPHLMTRSERDREFGQFLGIKTRCEIVGDRFDVEYHADVASPDVYDGGTPLPFHLFPDHDHVVYVGRTVYQPDAGEEIFLTARQTNDDLRRLRRVHDRKITIRAPWRRTHVRNSLSARGL